MLCCSFAASAKRGDTSGISLGEEPRVSEHCRGAEAGCRWRLSPACMARRYLGWVLAIRSPSGNCSLVGEFSAVTRTHIKSAMYGVRKMQSSLVTWRCVLPLLAGAGHWTYQHSGLACASCILHWQPSARGLKGEIQCSNARALSHLQCSPLGCRSVPPSPSVEGMIWPQETDLFWKAFYCNIFLLSDCTTEALHPYHAGSSWGSLILFF